MKTKTDKMIARWLEVVQGIKDPELQKQVIRDDLRDKASNPMKLAIFGAYFFPHIIKGSVPDCHIDLIKEMVRREDSAIIFPRGHAKSTWEKIDCIHDVIYGLEPVILYVGNTITDAQFHFEAIKSELESNDALKEVYGSVVPPEWQDSPKWTNKHFETTNKVNVVARGAGKGRGVNIKNQRPTKIVIDDAEDDELVRSPERRQKFHNWVHNVIIPSMDRERGFLKFIGTVLNDECEVLKFYQTNGGIFRKAIENGKSIWWPMEKLEKLKKKIGSIAFAQEYMNEPTNEETAMVKFSWLRFYEEGQEPPNLTKYSYADLAISSSTKADYFVILTVGVDSEGTVWILDMFREKGVTFAAQVEAVIQTHIKWNLTRMGIESVAYQKALEQEVKRRSNELKVYVPVVPIIPDGDKERQLLRTTPQIENGTIRFLRKHVALIEELTRFPNAGHDDTVDTLTGVMRLIGTGTEGKIYILGEDEDEDNF